MATSVKRTILVTGANRGIGLAIARQLAELENSVLFGSRDLKAGEEAARSLQYPGLDIQPIQIDLTDPAAIDSALNNIVKSGRKIDALVNNAGVLHEKPILELTEAEIAESIAVHRAASSHPRPGARNDRTEVRPHRESVVRLGIVRRGHGRTKSLRSDESRT